MADYGNMQIGTRVRVRIKARIGRSEDNSGPLNTTRVVDTSSWSHFLYLDSDSVTPDGDFGNMVTCAFDAEVTGDIQAGQAVTTQVNEIIDGEPYGPAHFLYLGSDQVTELVKYPDGAYRTREEQEELDRATLPVRVTSENGVKGAKIRVNIKGMVTGGGYEANNATTLTQDQNGYAHKIYLGSRYVDRAIDRRTDKSFKAVFDAIIDGDYAGDAGALTAVSEIGDSIGRGYTHYLYLNSPSVTLLPEGKPAEEPAEAPAEEPAEAPKTATVEKGSTVSIDRYDEEITYRQVQDRIEDLELNTATGYSVVRVRNEEVLSDGYDDEGDAREYIEDNDYNPERVIVRESDPDEDEVEELEMLAVLNSDCASRFGRSWKDGDVTLRREDYFDDDWARDEAMSELSVSNDELESWPLNLVDWSDARDQRLENDYEAVDFDGTEFYGRI